MNSQVKINNTINQIFNQIQGQCSFSFGDISQIVKYYSRDIQSFRFNKFAMKYVSNDIDSITLKITQKKNNLRDFFDCLVIISKIEEKRIEKKRNKSNTFFRKLIGFFSQKKKNQQQQQQACSSAQIQLPKNQYSETYVIDKKYFVYSVEQNTLNPDQDFIFDIDQISEEDYQYVQVLEINPQSLKKSKEVIQNCINIQKLRFCCQNETVELNNPQNIISEISDIIQNQDITIPQLQIYLNFEKLQQREITQLGESIMKCKNLNSIQLQQYQDYYQVEAFHIFKIFNNSYCKCSNITSLKIDFLQHGSYSPNPHIETFFKDLSKFHNLQTLDLNLFNHPMQEEAPAALGETLSKLTNLQILNIKMEYSLINANSQEDFINGLKNCKNLVELRLNLTGGIYPKIAVLIASSIKNFILLRVLTLYLTGSENEYKEVFSNEIIQLQNLQRLNINLTQSEKQNQSIIKKLNQIKKYSKRLITLNDIKKDYFD